MGLPERTVNRIGPERSQLIWSDIAVVSPRLPLRGYAVGPDDSFSDHALWAEGHFSPALGDQFVWHAPDHAFVGTRFTLDDGVHFGFMEVELIRSQSQVNARPLRWGYESEAGVPFAMSAVVPEPAAGLLIPAGCSIALLRCRARGRRSH